MIRWVVHIQHRQQLCACSHWSRLCSGPALLPCVRLRCFSDLHFLYNAAFFPFYTAPPFGSSAPSLFLGAKQTHPDSPVANFGRRSVFVSLLADRIILPTSFDAAVHSLGPHVSRITILCQLLQWITGNRQCRCKYSAIRCSHVGRNWLYVQ